jgi:hypothetical protein
MKDFTSGQSAPTLSPSTDFTLDTAKSGVIYLFEIKRETRNSSQISHLSTAKRWPSHPYPNRIFLSNEDIAGSGAIYNFLAFCFG